MHTLSRRSTTMARIGAVVLVLLWERPLRSQLPPQDGIQVLLSRLQQTLERDDAAGFAALFTDAVSAPQVAQYREEMFSPDAVRYVLRERERIPLHRQGGWRQRNLYRRRLGHGSGQRSSGRVRARDTGGLHYDGAPRIW